MRVFFFVSFAVLLSSCFDKGDCLYVNTNLVKVNLMDLDTPSRTHPIVLDTIFGPIPYKFGVDTTVTAFALVVDPVKTESTFILSHNGTYDTLILGYTSHTIVLSPDCGAALFQENLEVKYSTFDSVRIVTGQLLTSAKVNIEIRL